MIPPSQSAPTRASLNSSPIIDYSTIDRVRAAWKRLGVQFSGGSSAQPTDLEVLLVETAGMVATDERLFVGVATWLSQYHGFVNGRRLSALVARLEPTTTAYLGALLSVASEAAGRAPELEAGITRCVPLVTPRPLYQIMNSMPALRDRVHLHALSVYAQWGLWHDDATLKVESIRPLIWLLSVPELRARAVFGPSVEADIMARAFLGDVTAQAVARETGVSYAAAHAAASRLVHRGMLTRERHGVRQFLSLSAYARPLFGLEIAVFEDSNNRST